MTLPELRAHRGFIRQGGRKPIVTAHMGWLDTTIIIIPKPPSKPYGTGSGMGYESFDIFVIGDESIKEDEEVIMLVLQLFVRLWE